MSDWIDDDETPEVKEWKAEAQKFHQIMFLRLGDREWDEWDKSDKEILRHKIRFGKEILLHKIRFGLNSLPESLPEIQELKKKQSEIVELITDEILKNAASGEKIYFACLFVFGLKENKRFYVPVFKIKGKENQILFIDSDCYIYDNWQNYLNYNHLSECLYSYPRDGLYQARENQVLIDFCKSSCDKIQISTVDNTATEMNYASILKMMNSLGICTQIQAPVELNSASIKACNTTLSVEDQQLYGESLASNVSATRGSWLRVIKLLKARQREIHKNITQAAAAGEVATREEAIVYDVVTFASLTLNGLEILRDIFLLADKKQKGTLTELDDLNFETSVLFFSNNIIQANTARKVIENTQQEVLNQHCDDLTSSQINELFKLIEFSKGKTQLQRNANNIKAINRIQDKQTFYENLVIATDLEGHAVGFSSEEPGVVSINNGLDIAPNKFVEISLIDRLQILEATKKFKTNGIDKDYKNKIQEILRDNRIKMKWQRDEDYAELKRVFNPENLDTIKIGGKELFKKMTPSEQDRLFKVIKAIGKNYAEIVKITNEFAKKLNCQNPRDYSNYVEFVTKYINDLKEEKIQNYKEALKDAKIKRGINDQTFSREMGIKGKQSVFFFNQVYDDFLFNPEDRFKDLEEKYIALEKEVSPINANAVPNFASDTSAVYHYFKHRDFNETTLTAEQYFSLASELVNERLNIREAKLNQQGDTMVMIFTNSVNGAKGIVFEKLIDGTQSLATVYYDKAVMNR